MATTRRSFTDAFKREAVSLLASSGRPLTQTLLTPEDVAVQLGVSRKALERWRGTGDGSRFVRLGHKTIRYRVEDVEAFVAERLCVSTAA